MPKPASGSSVIRPDLGTVAFEALMDAEKQGFIGLSLLPVFPTAKQSGQYPIIPLEAILKTKDTTRAARSRYNRDDYNFEMGNYSCKDRGHEEPLDDTEREMYAALFDAEEVAVKRAVNRVLRAQEMRIAAMLFNSSNLTVGNVTTEWSTAATATPYDDILAAKEAMRGIGGLLPNKIGMSWKVFNNLLKTKELKDALRYTSPIEMGGFDAQKRAVAQYFGVSEVLVAAGVKDTSGKGKATVISDLWDDEYVILAATGIESQDLREPCLGRTFLWTEDSPEMTVVESYREEQSRSDIYRVRHNVDEAFVFKGAGYLLGNITA